jgi:DNA-directed RNA polymerase subunit RPC12/RpoP
MECKVVQISPEEFYKAWKEVEEFQKNYQWVYIVGNKVFCSKCQEELPRMFTNDTITCTNCGETYPVKRIKEHTDK